MKTATAREVKERAQELGVKMKDHGNGARITAPAGYVFVRNGSHTRAAWIPWGGDPVDKAEIWGALLEDMEAGVELCEADHYGTCDTCRDNAEPVAKESR